MADKENPKDPTFNVRELVELSVKRLDDLAEARRTRYEEKFCDKDNQYQLQFSSAKEAVAAALEGTREAINKADVNTDKRFSLLSEKVDGIMDTINKNTGERGIYVTHSDLQLSLDRLQSNIEATLKPVVAFMNSAQGQSKGLNAGWIYLLGGVSLFSSIIAIFVALSK